MRYIQTFISLLIIILLVSSCNQDKIEQINQLKSEKEELTIEIQLLSEKIDSLLETPAIQFQNILSNKKINLNDTSSIDAYLKFKQKYPNSIWTNLALFQINKIENSKKEEAIDTAEDHVFGNWKWVSSFNAWFLSDATPENTDKTESILMKSDYNCLFYKNGELQKRDKFEIESFIDNQNRILVYVNFENEKDIVGNLEPPYKFMTLIPNCEDCTYKTYKKVD
ncbi:MAG: hypothetical protein CMC96_02460 [Flavobacteriales bacterium]|nr:hypothetical protein [Flavobacteriales bacterium]|tara:strand:- start:3190 stop:3861 length:672 start_codon:yes stop_codon:yes gene_type:complete